MKTDKTKEPKKSVHKINIDDLPDLGDDTGSQMGDTKVFMDLPLEDEDFEFRPDYDELGLFDEDLIQEPLPASSRQRKKESNTEKAPSGQAPKTPKTPKSPDVPVSEKKRIKKLELTPEEIRVKKEDRKKRRSQNPEILAVTYVFAALFVLMIGYFVYFNAFVSKDVINSAYNVRINSFADSIIRGNILASDGTVLAETIVDENGNESRYYPMGRIFSHAVGTSDINQSGVELAQNFYMLQSNGNPLLNALNDIRGGKNQGDQVVTTLDTALQETAYNALGYNDGAVIAIEPTTGKILAMVSKPDYDPNTLVWDYDTIVSEEGNDMLLNKVTSGLFIPGSIFKTLTSLAYIRSGADYNNYYYTCEGQINLGGEEYISCFDHTVHGGENFWESYAYSCNSSFGNIGLSLPKNLLKETCESLLFNQQLPTSLPHTKSAFNMSENASDWDVAATSIGQGHTQVTPLQMAMITSAIANGGNLMKPYMVDSIVTAGGGRRVKKFLPEAYDQILSTQEANLLSQLMEGVTEYGTASSLSGYGYTVAGKTGTAEVSGRGDNSWFIGYAPAEHPKIAICVLVENDEGYYESALPVANALLQNYLNR